MEQSDTQAASWQKLTSLERLLLRLSEQPGEMVFRLDMHFNGVFDLEQLQSACEIAILKHPLLRMHVEARSRWVENQATVHVTFDDIGKMPTWIARPLTPFASDQGVGVAIHLTRSSDNKSLISLDFDHIRVDGQGACRYARDVLQAYFGNSEASNRPVRIDYAQLQQRGEYERPKNSAELSIKEKLRNFADTVRGANLRFPNQVKLSTTAPESLHSTEFIDVEETRVIHECIRVQGYTLNDVALAASMIAIGTLRTEVSQDAHVCVMNPVDLRTWSDRRLSASNRFGFAFVRRQIHSLHDPMATLRSVAEQMIYVRKRGVASELVQGFELAQKVPGLISAIEWTKRFIPTANFTCMSNTSPGRRIGLQQENGVWCREGISHTNVSGCGPLPPHVPLTLALTDTGTNLSLNVRGRVGCIEPAEVHRLAETWRQALIGLTKRLRAE